MKRWIASIVAALFLSTATLHAFAHLGESSGDCAVCHVHVASLPAAAAPVVADTAVAETQLPALAVPRVVSTRIVFAPARAPPSRPA